jgi:hypothetical protein
LGGFIPIEPEYRASKEVIVPLSTAVARENNRGSITNAQRARRAAAGPGSRTTAGSGSRATAGSGSRATAGSGSRATAGSGSRSKPAIASSRLRQRLDPSPDQQPEPIKKTQKRKVVWEVDLGPRKLRSRK